MNRLEDLPRRLREFHDRPSYTSGLAASLFRLPFRYPWTSNSDRRGETFCKGDRFGETSSNHFSFRGAIGYRYIKALRCFNIGRRAGSPLHCVTTNDLRRQPHRTSTNWRNTLKGCCRLQPEGPAKYVTRKHLRGMSVLLCAVAHQRFRQPTTW